MTLTMQNEYQKLIPLTVRRRWEALEDVRRKREKRKRDAELSRRRGATSVRLTVALARLNHIKARYEREAPSAEHEARIASLVAAFRTGVPLPPIRVLSRSQGLCLRGSHLLDGHHRLTAARRAGAKSISIVLVI